MRTKDEEVMQEQHETEHLSPFDQCPWTDIGGEG